MLMPTSYPQATEIALKDFKNASTSPYVKNYTDERKQRLVELLDGMDGVKILKFPQSLCPGCVDEEC